MIGKCQQGFCGLFRGRKEFIYIKREIINWVLRWFCGQKEIRDWDCAEEEIDSLIGRENETPVQTDSWHQLDITLRAQSRVRQSCIVTRWCDSAAMLFLQKLKIVMVMMITGVAGGMSLSREDLAKLDRNVVQMYEMVHTKVKTCNSFGFPYYLKYRKLKVN